MASFDFASIQDYCFFIGRFELQYPHEADHAPSPLLR